MADQITVSLPDGSPRDLPAGSTAGDLAAAMASNLAVTMVGDVGLVYASAAVTGGALTVGPPDAHNGRFVISDAQSPELTYTAWTCTASGGAACPAPSGSGSIVANNASLPTGGQLSYRVTAQMTASAICGASQANPASILAAGSVATGNGNDGVAFCTAGRLAFGVPSGGAMDPAALESGNALVGNPGGAVALEMTLAEVVVALFVAYYLTLDATLALIANGGVTFPTRAAECAPAAVEGQKVDVVFGRFDTLAEAIATDSPSAPDGLAVPSTRHRLRCTACGEHPMDVRPDWQSVEVC